MLFSAMQNLLKFDGNFIVFWLNGQKHFIRVSFSMTEQCGGGRKIDAFLFFGAFRNMIGLQTYIAACTSVCNEYLSKFVKTGQSFQGNVNRRVSAS